MQFAKLVLTNTVKSLLKKQLIICLAVGIIAFYFYNIDTFYAAIFGGSITVIGTIVIALHIARAANVGVKQKQQGYIEIYLGVIKKFVVTILLFIIGLGFLELEPKIVVLAFILTQLSYLFNRVDTSYTSNR